MTAPEPKPSSLQPQHLWDADKVLVNVLERVSRRPDALAEILDERSEPFIAFVANRTMVYANVAAERFFGVERHQLEARSAELLLPERLRTPGAPPQVAASDLTTVELPALRADGTEVSTAWTFAAVARPNDEPIFVMLVRAREELIAELAALQRSDRRFRTLLLASTSVVWVTTAEGLVEELLPAWEEYTGQTWEQYRDAGWISAIHPDDRAQVMRDWQAALQTKSDAHRTHGRIWSAKHSAWRAFQARAVCVRKLDGEAVEWVGAMTDVQDAFDARERLRESEARYAVLFEQSPTPMALSRRADSVLVAVNQAFAELFELSERDAIGRQSIELGLSRRELHDEVMQLFAQQGSLRGYECERTTASGKKLFVSLYLNPVQIDGVDHILTTVLDISARKSHEIALSRAMQDERVARNHAEAASRAKDEFLATMSHELRTPLQSILGWATLLSDGPVPDPQHARGLEVIRRNAQAQERLVSDLLDMSRIVSGKLTLTMERVLLTDLVANAVEVVRPAATSKGVELVVALEPHLPALVADGARLQQVLWNLLANAVRHTRRGGSITIRAEQVGDAIRIRVADTGEGIEAEHLARIFDRYRQLDSATTRKHGGLGLGLAIVRHLVAAHGGTVEAHSAGPDQGATFTVTIPVLAVHSKTADTRSSTRAEKSDEQAAAGRPPAEKNALHDVRVLVIEDQPDSLELITNILEAAGADVTGVDNAPGALGCDGVFDVVISDIALPGMDGYELLQRFRETPGRAHIPVIALTAFAGREHVARARAVGFQEHVVKPVDPAKLLETVKRWAQAPSA